MHVALLTVYVLAAPAFARYIETIDSRARFSCPPPMVYSPWAKACSCNPGQHWDFDENDCVGDTIRGSWPKPSIAEFASNDVDLATFCAESPSRIVQYDAEHAYCRASTDTIAFSAPKALTKELNLLGGSVNLDKGGVSKALKDLTAGLMGLYLEDVEDAIKLFNTDDCGHGTRAGDVLGGLTSGVAGVIKNLARTLRLSKAKCNYDCVSYCSKGCDNFLDVGEEVGGLIKGLTGLCALPDKLCLVDGLGKVVNHAVDELLCTVGSVTKKVLKMFDCKCGSK